MLFLNVALASVSSLLLCLNDHDSEQHLKSVDACEGHYESPHMDATSEQAVVCEIKEDCMALELQGGELVPSRLNDTQRVELPALSAIACSTFPVVQVAISAPKLRPSSRAPPSVHWLTALYIHKTVLRV